MKKIVSIFFLSIFLISCSSNFEENDLLPFVTVSQIVDLSLPQYNNLQVPGGWAYTSGGIKGIIIYNINGNQYKAFERAAPHLTLSNCSQMVVENNLRMMCPCDDSEFNILNGAPLTPGITYNAREYLVTDLNGISLRITNF
jgi:nitrite reductase/ring-hydroxylating ferredoxin subunit